MDREPLLHDLRELGEDFLFTRSPWQQRPTSGGALPTKQASSGLHSTIFTYGRAGPEEMAERPERRSEGTGGSARSTGFSFTSFGFADFFEGILRLLSPTFIGKKPTRRSLDGQTERSYHDLSKRRIAY